MTRQFRSGRHTTGLSCAAKESGSQAEQEGLTTSEWRCRLKQNNGKDTVTVVCILARGTEAGEEIKLLDPEFQALTNSPVSFAVFSSSYRAGDRPGDIITTRRDEFIELPPVKTVLHFGKKAGAARIPVSLGIKLNEFGTLDVWCESRKTPHRWKLAFQLRMQAEIEKAQPHPARRDLHTIEESAVEDALCDHGQGFPRQRKRHYDGKCDKENG